MEPVGIGTTELFQGKEYWYIPNTYVLWAVGQPVSYAASLFYQVNPQTGNPEWYLPTNGKLMEIRRDPTTVTTSFVEANLLQNRL